MLEPGVWGAISVVRSRRFYDYSVDQDGLKFLALGTAIEFRERCQVKIDHHAWIYRRCRVCGDSFRLPFQGFPCDFKVNVHLHKKQKNTPKFLRSSWISVSILPPAKDVMCLYNSNSAYFPRHFSTFAPPGLLPPGTSIRFSVAIFFCPFFLRGLMKIGGKFYAFDCSNRPQSEIKMC